VTKRKKEAPGGEPIRSHVIAQDEQSAWTAEEMADAKPLPIPLTEPSEPPTTVGQHNIAAGADQKQGRSVEGGRPE
jgi:hypothetical protein